MRTIETTLYKFDELSDAAKQTAMQKWREAGHDDLYWSECVLHDAADIADLFGLDIRQRRVTCTDGSYRYEPAVTWSGFWSQGDGLAFEGTYRYAKGALAAVKAHAPQDEGLHRIVERLQRIQRWHFYKLLAQCTPTRGNNMRVEVQDANDYYRDIGNAESELADELQSFAHWIYCQLEQEYEYQNSDEQVADMLRINEYEFDSEGNMQ